MQKNTAIGACLGASTISFVKTSGTNGKIVVEDFLVLAHNGNPKDVFLENLKRFNPEMLPVAVTGRKFRKIVSLPNIPEPYAAEYAYEAINQSITEENNQENCHFDAIASLGGETFLVYTLDSNGKIANVISKNQCASGTGEFFLQQIKRMDVSVDTVMEIAADAEPHKVSGRCSVFCKSDCTHALNKGTPKAEVSSGLAKMMSEKIEELLNKAKAQKVVLTGGVTRNNIVMNFLKKEFPKAIIPKESYYFEALGAAAYALDKALPPMTSFDNIFTEAKSSFAFLEPLSKHTNKVDFKTISFGQAKKGDKCILGLDVGSTTTKAVIIRASDQKILATIYLYTHGDPIKAAKKCYNELLKQITKEINLVGVGTTGSGRHIAGLHALTDGVFNEIIAHATAAVYFDPEVDTIFEIGGQDAKYTYIVNKVPADYAMNEACSAGTGSFIEEAAFEALGLKVSDVEPIAMQGKRPPNFSDQCSAFINADIKTATQESISREDIVAGLTYSICMNYVNRVKGNRPVGKKIFMQGGVCYNKAIPIAMAALTDKEIIVPPEPGLMGAFGVALEVLDKINLGIFEEKSFSLKELAKREVEYAKPFICPGGREKCDLKCPVNIIKIEGKKYPFGGSCNKYYNINKTSQVDYDKYDFVKIRQELVYQKYASKTILPASAKTVGINRSFQTHTLYPLYSHFFTSLGFRVVLSDTVEGEGIERELTSLCYPGQLSMGLFQDLINKKTDFIFVPNILEMLVGEKEYQRMDFNTSCIFVSGEPYYLKQAYREYDIDAKLIAPIFNFANGYDQEETNFIKIGKQLGIDDEELIKKAYYNAVDVQNTLTEELFTIGRDFLKKLEEDPDMFAIILVGRPYNTFAEDANKGIPRKFASRGIYVIPYDMLDFREEKIDDDMYWESGKKILKVTKLIKRHSQLFATYVSNFSCAPDSMIITHFREIMDTKPSLTLELDGHTADAGINTRIEAALDIIGNYRRIQDRVKDTDLGDYRQASIEIGKDEGYFLSSEGGSISLNDPRVKILIPSMGALASRLFAAGMRSQGFDAEAVREPNAEVLKMGRAVATGKECLPLLIMSGSLLDYAENHWNGKGYLCFFIAQGAGNCRLGTYPAFMRNVIRRKRLKNVATLELMHEDGFAGLGPNFASRGIEMLIASDVLDDVRSGILAHSKDPQAGLDVFNEEFDRLIDVVENDYSSFYKSLKTFAKNINTRIPAAKHIDEAKYIALVGEMYVRRDSFSHKWLNEVFAKQGFIVKDAYISEWIFYVDYLLKNGLYEPLVSFKNKYERLVRIVYMRYAEQRIKQILTKTGYYKFFRTKIAPLVKHGKHIVPLEFKGEPLLIVGTGINDSIDKYCGIISVGPFGCMQTRFAESVTVPEMNIENKLKIKQMYDPKYKLPEVFNGKMNIPFLPIETDGNVYPQIIEARIETFALQASRMAELMKQSRNGNGNSYGKNNGKKQ